VDSHPYDRGAFPTTSANRVVEDKHGGPPVRQQNGQFLFLYQRHRQKPPGQTNWLLKLALTEQKYISISHTDECSSNNFKKFGLRVMEMSTVMILNEHEGYL
jgi:hypothetical protein